MEVGTVAEQLYKAGEISGGLYRALRTGSYLGTAFSTGFGLGYGSGELWQSEWKWLNRSNGGR